MFVFVNSKEVLLSAGLALALLFIASSSAAAQPTTGFAAYQVSVKTPSGVHTALINETVSQSSKAGLSDVVLQFFGSQQNLTYSRLVNSSYDLLPYFPFVGNQSIDYSNGTLYSIRVNITMSGDALVTFEGSAYTLSVSSIAVAGSYGNRTLSADGTVETFPSALVYSAAVGNSTYGVEAVLQGTDLPLSAGSTMSPAAAYAGAGVGVGAIAVAGAFLIRRRSKKVETKGEKPLHWVD
jgi:hypothetical protein